MTMSWRGAAGTFDGVTTSWTGAAFDFLEVLLGWSASSVLEFFALRCRFLGVSAVVVGVAVVTAACLLFKRRLFASWTLSCLWA